MVFLEFASLDPLSGPDKAPATRVDGVQRVGAGKVHLASRALKKESIKRRSKGRFIYVPAAPGDGPGPS